MEAFELHLHTRGILMNIKSCDYDYINVVSDEEKE